MADMPKKKISELTQATSVKLTDMFEVSEPYGETWNSKSMTIQQLKDYIFATVFPIGSIYMTVQPRNVFDPDTKFGGTWELFAEGKTLFGVDGNKSGKSKDYIDNWCTPEVEGGEATLTLDTNTMPQHRHNVNVFTSMNKGAIEFDIRHPYDVQNSYDPSIRFAGGTIGIISKRGSSQPWNTGSVCKTQPSEDQKKGDKISITLPGIQTSVTVENNGRDPGAGTAIPTYPPYVTCYIYKRTA